jgi:alpha-beta hydrolase superfamily lysophospholipase
MRGLIVSAFAALFIAASVPKCAAEQVSLDYLGLELTANLEIARGKSLKGDGAVILVHDTLGHSGMELMSALQDSLRDMGVNSLAITLGLGMDKRRGMFDCKMEQDHRHEDAVDEIAGWVQWLKEKGAASITLAGHGRGANQVALYAINRQDKAVKRAVLMSPLMQNENRAEAEYRSRFGKSLREELGKAEELVAGERGNQLVDAPGFLSCTNPKVTAGAFANYYGVNPKFKTTNLLQSIKVPVLIAVGDADPVLTDIQSAEPDFASIKTVTLAVISGADQDFRDLGAEELAKKIKEFIGHKLAG